MTANVGYLTIPQSDGEQDVPLENGNAWRLGRASDSQIKLPGELVSRQHALVQRMENGEYCLFDLGSRNGTFLNGTRVTIPVTLNDGDRISLGDFHVSFHCPKKGQWPSGLRVGFRLQGYDCSFHTENDERSGGGCPRFHENRTGHRSATAEPGNGTLFRSGGEIMRRHGSWGRNTLATR